MYDKMFYYPLRKRNGEMAMNNKVLRHSKPGIDSFKYSHKNDPLCQGSLLRRGLKQWLRDYLEYEVELIELAFEMNKLPIGKGSCERLRKTSQDEGRCRPDKITHDEPTRVVINYFK